LNQSIQASFWQRLRYNLFGRSIPGVLFGFLGWLQLGHLRAAIEQVRTLDWFAILGIYRASLYCLFCAAPALVYLTRPIPRARDGRLLPRAAAFTGTLMLLVVGAFLPAGPVLWTAPVWVPWIQLAVLTLATALALWAVFTLRRNLSIIPEARRMVTGGPYRLVRHPMYLAEIVAAGSLLLAQPRLVSTLAWCVFVPIQLLRAHYEEGLLSRVFPNYAAFRAGRKRLLPGVW
jgi:protein-S-isoprenylcysteine O-methyltransferase Ste14